MYQLPLFNRHRGTWAEGQNLRIREFAVNLLRNDFTSLNPLPRTLHEFQLDSKNPHETLSPSPRGRNLWFFYLGIFLFDTDPIADRDHLSGSYFPFP